MWVVVCFSFPFSFWLSFVGLALADAAPAPGPVPSQDTSLAPSLRRASLAHATVNLVLAPAQTNLAVDQPVASLAPAQTSASPGLRALLKWSRIAGGPRRSRSARSPGADLLLLWRMAMGGVPSPSLLPALQHLRLGSLQTGIHAPAQSLARAPNPDPAPAPAPDPSPKTSFKCRLNYFFLFVFFFPSHLFRSPVFRDSFLMVMMGSRSKLLH